MFEEMYMYVMYISQIYTMGLRLYIQFPGGHGCQIEGLNMLVVCKYNYVVLHEKNIKI